MALFSTTFLPFFIVHTPLKGEGTIKKFPPISLKICVWGFLGARTSNPGCVFQNFHQKVVKSDNGNFPDFPGFRAIFRISGENFIKPTPDSDSWPKTTYMGIFSCPLGHFLKKNVNFLDFPGFPRFRKIYLLLQYSS